MTLSHLIIFFFIYVILCFTIIYSLLRTNKWVNEKQRLIEELSIDIPDYINQFRAELKKFNHKLEYQYIPAPLSSQELGSFVSEIISDIVKSKIPISPFKNKLFIFSTFFKIWKFRHRLKATLMLKGI
jgi:hypothetical protein